MIKLETDAEKKILAQTRVQVLYSEKISHTQNMYLLSAVHMNQ
jgi:hypothetical protein